MTFSNHNSYHWWIAGVHWGAGVDLTKWGAGFIIDFNHFSAGFEIHFGPAYYYWTS